MFGKRLVEQVVVTFVGAAVPVLLATHDSFGKAVVVAAIAAGLRAVYGFLVKPVGDSSQPNAVK